MYAIKEPPVTYRITFPRYAKWQPKLKPGQRRLFLWMWRQLTRHKDVRRLDAEGRWLFVTLMLESDEGVWQGDREDLLDAAAFRGTRFDINSRLDQMAAAGLIELERMASPRGEAPPKSPTKPAPAAPKGASESLLKAPIRAAREPFKAPSKAPYPPAYKEDIVYPRGIGEGDGGGEERASAPPAAPESVIPPGLVAAVEGLGVDIDARLRADMEAAGAEAVEAAYLKAKLQQDEDKRTGLFVASLRNGWRPPPGVVQLHERQERDRKTRLAYLQGEIARLAAEVVPAPPRDEDLIAEIDRLEEAAEVRWARYGGAPADLAAWRAAHRKRILANWAADREQKSRKLAAHEAELAAMELGTG